MSLALIIAGPSAAGKTTVAEKIIAVSGGAFELSRSLTTREKRGDAFDGEYVYTTREGFEKELSFGRVLEHTEYSGELYGTPLSEIERIFDSGKIPLLILDLNGVKSVTKRTDVVDPCAVYLYCDNETLRKRLYSRYLSQAYSEELEAKMEKRLRQNLADLSVLSDYSDDFYDFVDNNKDPDVTAKEILRIFEEFSSKIPRNSDKVLDALDKIRTDFKK